MTSSSGPRPSPIDSWRDGSDVGPYAHLRGGTRLGPRVHVGNFAELKNAAVDEEAKIGHFSYVGDATIGAGTNIGAGTVTCNFDGVDKHRTEIGADVFIGSDTMLVAPVTLGDGARTGAGSVVTRDVRSGRDGRRRPGPGDPPTRAGTLRTVANGETTGRPTDDGRTTPGLQRATAHPELAAEIMEELEAPLGRAIVGDVAATARRASSSRRTCAARTSSSSSRCATRSTTT